MNLDDILCVLGGFSTFANCPFGDVHPRDAIETVGLDDSLRVLAAFSGALNRLNPCGPWAAGSAPHRVIIERNDWPVLK